jgi:uncharacterized membrane protein YdjX (TVP38/TMEM64 family)
MMMTGIPDQQPLPAAAGELPRFSVRRLLPLVVIAALVGIVYWMGWQRELSFETLVKHRAAIDDFVAHHRPTAVAAFIGIYVVAVALSLPAGAVLTTTAGFLFGTLVGGLAAMVGATVGATIIFLIAKTAVGEHLLRRAGPLAAKFAEGFRADAFSYMLFLRLVPFPFWLVNLAPALFGVRLRTFVSATVIGIIPATFSFAFFGAGLESAVSAQELAYKECVAGGRTDCGVMLDPAIALTPELLAALAVLVVVGLIPILAKRMRGRARASSTSG